MTYLELTLIRHRRLLRTAWLVALLALAACQPDTNGGGNGY